MIRIVDILKKAGEWGEGKDNGKKVKEKEKGKNEGGEKKEPLPKKQPDLLPEWPEEKLLPAPAKDIKPTQPIIYSAEEISSLYANLAQLTNNMLAPKQAGDKALEAGRGVVLLIEQLVEQVRLSNQELIKVLDQQKPDDERYYKLFRFVINSLKLGLDTKYSKEKLLELAVTVFVHEIQVLWVDDAAGVKTVKDLMTCCAKYDVDAYDNIIKLAEIYQSTAL